MIRNVFGKPVTESTVRSLSEYQSKSTISSKDMANVALLLKNSQEKDEKVLIHVEKLREQNAQNNTVSTLGWIYNATGNAIDLYNSCDWNGSVASNPYPVRIENGQWGMFLHEETNSFGSSAAVVYETVYGYGRRGWCVAWETSADRSVKSKVYAEVRDVGWYMDDRWNRVHNSLEESRSLHRAKGEGFLSVITATRGPHAIFEALLTLESLTNEPSFAF